MPFSSVPPLVTADWLHDHIDDPSVVVLDCRWRLTDAQYGKVAYEGGHIQNARHVDLDRDLSDPVGRYGGRHPLPSPDHFQKVMEDAGVTSESFVVCYADDAAAAARCWWLLQYYGHPKAGVLDGGIDAWQKAGYPLSCDTPEPAHGQFAASPDPRMVADYRTVESVVSRVPVIDARAPERFRGDIEPIDIKAGHIPGAVNHPYSAVLNEDGTYLASAELHRSFAPILRDHTPAIVYCGSGVTACVDILALKLAGIEALLYAGSWSDWIQHEGAPIETS